MTLIKPEPTREPEPTRAASVAPVPTLRFVTGPAAGSSIQLEHPEGTLGRREDNDYVVADPGVSRVHLRITRSPADTIVVTDLGSSSGTWVNGEAATAARAVVHGDRIRVGTSECLVEDPVAAARQRADTTTLMLAVPTVVASPALSPRQTEVLHLMADGMTNAEIGSVLGITERTVKAYAQEVYTRLSVRNRAGAVAEAIRLGLL